MIRNHTIFRLAGCLLVLGTLASIGRAQGSLTDTSVAVNKKMVKLFGIGGFKGLPSYGSGIVVSPKGHILTVNNHILINPGILVHLYDGRQFSGQGHRPRAGTRRRPVEDRRGHRPVALLQL